MSFFNINEFVKFSDVVWSGYFVVAIRTRLYIALKPEAISFTPTTVSLGFSVVPVIKVTAIECIASHDVVAKGSGSAMIWEREPRAKATVEMDTC